MSDARTNGLSADEFLNDALDGHEVEERDEGHVAAPEAPRSASGGYQPLIEKRRRELMALEDKILRHRETGVYVKKYDNGQEYFDQLAMSEDNVRIGRLSREIAEFKEKEKQTSEERNRRTATASDVASALLKREIPRLPQELREPVTRAFIEIFNGLSSSGAEWTKPVYADKAKMTEALQQVLDTALGNATRRQWAGSGPSGDPAGAPRGKPVENDTDDFTNNLMYAFQRKQSGSMTVADAKAAARAEAEKGRNS